MSTIYTDPNSINASYQYATSPLSFLNEEYASPADYNKYNTYRSPKVAAVDVDGNRYVAITLAYLTGNNPSYWRKRVGVIKYNPSGVIIWFKVLRTNDPSSQYANFIPSSIILDSTTSSNPNVYVTSMQDTDVYIGISGLIDKNRWSHNPSIHKIDSSGNILWKKYVFTGQKTDDYRISYFSSLENIILDSSGNVCVCGTIRYFSATSPYDANGNDIGIIMKFNSTGTLIWQKTFGYHSGTTYKSDKLLGMSIDSSDNIYICGASSYGPNVSNIAGTPISALRPIILKFNSSGTLLNRYDIQRFSGGGTTDAGNDRYNMNFIMEARDIKVDSSGNIYICGYSNSANTLNYGQRAFVMKLNSSFTIVWQKFLYGAIADPSATIHNTLDQIVLSSIELDSSGNVYVGGDYWLRNNIPNEDGEYTITEIGAIVAKYNNSGVLQWQNKFTAPDSSWTPTNYFGPGTWINSLCLTNNSSKILVAGGTYWQSRRTAWSGEIKTDGSGAGTSTIFSPYPTSFIYSAANFSQYTSSLSIMAATTPDINVETSTYEVNIKDQWYSVSTSFTIDSETDYIYDTNYSSAILSKFGYF